MILRVWWNHPRLTFSQLIKLGKLKKSIFTLGANLNQSAEDSDGDLEALNIFFDNSSGVTMESIQEIVQNQFQTDDQTDYRLQLSFVRPVSYNKFLEFFYERRNYNNELVRDVTDLLINQIDIDLSTHYKRDYNYDQYGLSYSVNTDKSQLTLEGALQKSRLIGDTISNDL